MLSVIQGIAFLFGLVIGSFLTVVVYRVPRKESLVRPRSRCPVCGTQIKAMDNIPVVSWVIRGGKCRACGARISVRYPLTELTNGLLWAAAALKFDEQLLVALTVAVFFSVLLAVSLIDLEHKIIPNRILYPAAPLLAAMVVVGAVAGEGLSLAHAAVGLLAYGGGLLLVALIYPKGMGMGDVKLVALIGLVLGALGLRLVVVSAVLGFFLGGVGGVLAMALGGKGRKSQMPFGPFLAGGALLSVFLGARIAEWYLGLLG